MQKLQIPKNRMNYLIKQIQHIVNLQVLEQGWEVYHKGRLMALHMEEMKVLANLKGGGTYDVSLHLESFSQSTCNCDAAPYCAHLVAVCFILYTPYGRPELLFQQLKQVIYVRQKTLQPLDKEIARKPSPQLTVHATMSPSDWQRFFETKFYGFSLSHQHSIEHFYQTVTQTLPTYSTDWPPSSKHLYELHIYLFVLRKVEQFYLESKNSYLSNYHENGCKSCVQTCMKAIDGVLEQITSHDLKQVATSWHSTLIWLSEIGLLGKISPVDWLSLYRHLWWKAHDQTAWMDEEISRIEQILNKPELPAQKKIIWTMARMHFDIMQQKTEQAFSRFTTDQSLQASDFYFYFKYYTSQQQWEELLRWLRWLHPHIHKTNQDDFRTYCHYWLEVIPHLPSDQEWINVMESLLPRSYYYYTAYLLKSERYQAWVDLQLSNRISPLSLYAVELTAIENFDCSLLFPLYHQATERAILEKNRNSYKVAMRLLGQLRDYYFKLNQQSVWETYIYRLADKFSRLRSFQEELQRGNWIQ